MASTSHSQGAWLDALECVIGRAHAVVPASCVQSVVELALSTPPPLSRKWVGGLAFHQDRAVVCVSLFGAAAARTAGTRKGVLCQVQHSDIGWMVEVTTVLSFLQVQAVASTASADTPPWLTAAQTREGRMLGYVDVEGMVRALAGTA